MAGISQLDAARRQLDSAICLLDTEDLAAHTLAWAAFNLLFEMVGDDETRRAMHTVEKNLKLGKLPGFFRHVGVPNAILEEHSPETVYVTITLAIRLWEEHRQKLTDAMQEFGKRPNPYEPGHRHRAVVEAARHQPLSEFKNALTPPSTGSGLISNQNSPSGLDDE
jgi:hypothetical protein